MLLLILIYILGIIAAIAFLSIIFIGIKVLLMKYFEYYYTYKVLIHYGAFYFSILFLFILALFFTIPYLTNNQIFTMIGLPLLIAAFIYEYLVIFKRYFEFESRGQFLVNILVSYIGIVVITMIIVPIFLVLMTLITGV